MNLEQMKSVVRQHKFAMLADGGFKRSAVLVPFRKQSEDSDALDIVLTKRSAALRSHAGQISFPGGRVNEGETSTWDTAAREAHEEIGLVPQNVERLGRFDDFVIAVTGFHVAVHVGLIESAVPLKPTSPEVERILYLPLDSLLNEDGWELKDYTFSHGRGKMWRFPFDGEDIWGATAAMLRRMVTVLREANVNG